jgi:hypothetical protein
MYASAGAPGTSLASLWLHQELLEGVVMSTWISLPDNAHWYTRTSSIRPCKYATLTHCSPIWSAPRMSSSARPRCALDRLALTDNWRAGAMSLAAPWDSVFFLSTVPRRRVEMCRLFPWGLIPHSQVTQDRGLARTVVAS